MLCTKETCGNRRPVNYSTLDIAVPHLQIQEDKSRPAEMKKVVEGISEEFIIQLKIREGETNKHADGRP